MSKSLVQLRVEYVSVTTKIKELEAMIPKPDRYASRYITLKSKLRDISSRIRHQEIENKASETVWSDELTKGLNEVVANDDLESMISMSDQFMKSVGCDNMKHFWEGVHEGEYRILASLCVNSNALRILKWMLQSDDEQIKLSLYRASYDNMSRECYAMMKACSDNNMSRMLRLMRVIIDRGMEDLYDDVVQYYKSSKLIESYHREEILCGCVSDGRMELIQRLTEVMPEVTNKLMSRITDRDYQGNVHPATVYALTEMIKNHISITARMTDRMAYHNQVFLLRACHEKGIKLDEDTLICAIQKNSTDSVKFLISEANCTCSHSTTGIALQNCELPIIEFLTSNNYRFVSKLISQTVLCRNRVDILQYLSSKGYRFDNTGVSIDDTSEDVSNDTKKWLKKHILLLKQTEI